MKRAHRRTDAQNRCVAIDRILRTETEMRRTFEEILSGVNNMVPPVGIDREWGVRTLRRDIANMRKAGAPIATKSFDDPDGNRYEIYYYTDPDYRWPDIGFNQEDLHALQLAKKILEPYKKLHAVQHLSELAEELGAHIKPETHSSAEIPLYFSPLAEDSINPEIWQVVLEAATQRKVLNITYSGWKDQSAEENPRRIDPYAIVNLEGEWYLIGTANLTSESIRQYKLSRIKSAELTESPFEIPEEFDIHKLLDNTFGKFIGSPDDLETVQIRFSKRVALLILGTKWHPQQKHTKCENGDIILSFPVSKSGPWPFYHIISWILSWGSDAVVEAPEELKKRVAEELKKACMGNKNN